MSHHMLPRRARREQARKNGAEFKPLYNWREPGEMQAKLEQGSGPDSPLGRALATIERINRGGR